MGIICLSDDEFQKILLHRHTRRESEPELSIDLTEYGDKPSQDTGMDSSIHGNLRWSFVSK